MITMKNIDEIDSKLLNILQDNSRVTIRELSEKLHLSTTPIHERIKKLEKSGIIKQYVTLLDPKNSWQKAYSIHFGVAFKPCKGGYRRV
jgi:DNA-binding Lrp family transcriptional regulator